MWKSNNFLHGKKPVLLKIFGTIIYWGLIPTISICVTVNYGVNWPLLSILFLEFVFAVIMWFSLSEEL